MTTTYTVIQAVAGTKNKASVYNENFTRMKNYVDGSIDDMKTWTNNTVDLPITTLATSGEIELTDNSIGRITPVGAVTFTLPAVTNNNKFHQILVQLNLLDTSYVTADDNGLGTSNYFYKVKPVFNTTGTYDIIYEYDGANWVVGNIKKGSL